MGSGVMELLRYWSLVVFGFTVFMVNLSQSAPQVKQKDILFHSNEKKSNL